MDLNLDKVYRLLDVAYTLGLDDIVDIDMYVYKNPESELAQLYHNLNKNEFYELLVRMEK